ncbi:MAG: DUF1553 domain-containing protein, partial [Planctomycetota bacterium]
FGLTVACARCHDHKFDPIPTRDYYAMAGILNSTETCYGTVMDVNYCRRQADLIALASVGGPGTKLDAAGLKKLQTDVTDLQKQYKEAADAYAAEPDNGKLNAERRRLQVAVSRARARIDDFDAKGNPLAFAMGVREAQRMVNSPILLRGEVAQPSTVVPRGFPTVLGVTVGPIPAGESGRNQLADFIVSPDNPLTARVAVNRVWYHLLGRGIVETLDNFGTRCSPPSNQPLLDYLALSYRDNGWSLKALIREIMRSRVYRLAVEDDRDGNRKDTGNVLLWRANRKPLDSESLRDAMLQAAGLLEPDRPAASMIQEIGDEAVSAAMIARLDKLSIESGMRSVYLPVLRNGVPDMLGLFNFADPDAVNAERGDTIVPTQALYMMNGPLPIRAAAATAKRLMETTTDDNARIRLAWELILARTPDSTELTRARRFLTAFRKSLAKTFDKADPPVFDKNGKPVKPAKPDPDKMTDEERDLQTWSALAQVLFTCAEFRYLD